MAGGGCPPCPSVTAHLSWAAPATLPAAADKALATAVEAQQVASGAVDLNKEAEVAASGENFGAPVAPIPPGVDPADHARVMRHVEGVVADTVDRLAKASTIGVPLAR